MNYKIAIADSESLGKIDFLLEKTMIENLDVELHIFNYKTEEELSENLKDFHIILLVSAPFTKKVIDSLDNCRALIRYGIGVDSIDIDAASEKGILVCNEPSYSIEDVALHTTAMILNLTKKITLLDREVRLGNWEVRDGYPAHRLQGKVVGLIGFGNIARRVVDFLMPYKMRFIVFDPFLDTEQVKDYQVSITSHLDELLRSANFVSIHSPLTDDTRHLLSDEEFELMRKDAFLINTSRGPIVDKAALVKALKNNKIRGAGLDVFEKEPIKKDDELCSFDNVILTPHAAFYTEESFEQLRTSVIAQAISIINKEKPIHLINDDALEKEGHLNKN